jgi:hypothetical protein
MTADDPVRTEENHGARQREIEAALRDLNACVERIHALIPRVNAMIDRRTGSARPQARARVVYGGGPSAFAHRRRSGEVVPPPREVRPLIVAADLALGGYSKEQIRARVRELDQPGAAEALDEAFE